MALTLGTRLGPYEIAAQIGVRDIVALQFRRVLCVLLESGRRVEVSQ